MRNATGVAVLSLLLLASSAVAAPFDGPRWQEFGGQRYPLFVVPGALSITWAPGVVASWPEDAPPLGPDTLTVGDVTLQRARTIGGDRFFTERYEATTSIDAAETLQVARALLELADVQVASPLWALSPTDHEDPWAVTDHVLLQLSRGADEPALRALAAQLGIDVLRSRGLAPDQWVLFVPQRALVDPIEASMLLSEAPFVKWAEADWIVPMYARYTPSDPLYPDQWHLNNTGQVGGAPGNDMGVAAAWDITRGDEGTIVSAQDSGVDLEQPDLVEDLLPGYDFTNGDADPSPSSSHGTSVAGCMGAPENGEGVVGACPLCKILPVRVLGASNEATADAHDFSVTSGAAVINNSWGPSDSADPSTPQPIPNVVATAVEYAVTSGRDGKGVAIFWAGGNGNNNGQTCSQDGYVSHPDTIAVGASTNLGSRSSYSELCPELDLSGPSSGGTASITTTRIDNYTTSFGGTSAASPNAAGVGALVLSALPDLTFAELRDLLRNTAVKIDPGDADYDGNGHSLSYGYGRVNALNALQGQVASLSISVGPLRCDAQVAVTVGIPNAPGLGSLDVHASSDAEPAGETFTLLESSDGVYEGVVSLTAEPATPGDGLLSVIDGDAVVVSSVEADTSKQVTVDCLGPILSGFEVREITSTAAIIYWETNEPADGLAIWDGGSAADPIVDLDHLAVVVDLMPCTNYAASLTSTDAAGLSGTVDSAVAWRAPGDPSVLPEDVLPGADPCDESTWYEPETPAGDDDDATARGPGGFEGQGCSGCQSSVGGGGGPVALLALLGLLGVRRRRSAVTSS